MRYLLHSRIESLLRRLNSHICLVHNDVKIGYALPYISFSFEHDNSKFTRQIRINKKNTFIVHWRQIYLMVCMHFNIPWTFSGIFFTLKDRYIMLLLLSKC